jgi:hypothetical protein
MVLGKAGKGMVSRCVTDAMRDAKCVTERDNTRQRYKQMEKLAR